MGLAFPYSYISCPCSEASRRAFNNKRLSRDVETNEEASDEENTFDPRNSRSDFSLFPAEHVLYCEECHDIKCPRCVTEEIICTYCPGCLFEVPTSSVKQDYNRCSRNCFNCPVCTSQLVTTSVGDKNDGPWVLSCNYCMWSSLDIGIKFAQASGIRNQMDHLANGGGSKISYRDGSTLKGARSILGRELERDGRESSRLTSLNAREKSAENEVDVPPDAHARFEALKTFYKDQISASNPMASGVAGLDAFSSPSSLARIMNLYTSSGSASVKKSRYKSAPMREASIPAEGLQLGSSVNSQTGKLLDYSDAPSVQQLLFQHPYPIGNPDAKRVSELRPMPTQLRTKRSKRCAACKHILVKPEFKVTSTRYRIKLVALSYIPFVSLRPVPTSGGFKPAGPDGADVVLEPGKPSQWIMTLRNPLFETLSVSLGSPSTTPGKYGHKVTILCPEFSIGKNGDVWDDALNANAARAITSPGGGEQTAGKVYESGRNWTSVVIEIIPAPIVPDQGVDLREDEDIIEVPIRVRLEWTVIEEEGEEGLRKGKSDRALGDDGEADIGRRELAYWMVLGIGRVHVLR